MASQTASHVMVALCLLGLAARHAAEATQLVPAVFVFGDSTVDVGNNNYLNSTKPARANYPKYGVDFSGSTPTGRFSNGYNLADQLAQLLGFPKSPPAYLSLTAKTIVPQMYQGINFASGGSGLSDKTGLLGAGEVIPMSLQVQYFSQVVELMQTLSGSRRTASLLSESIFFISTGSNDIFEYFLSGGNGDDGEFLLGFTAAFRSYVRALYRLGARKFSIVSITPLGCTPSQRARRLSQGGTRGGCFGPINTLSLRSYPMLAASLRDLADELPGMAYSLSDSFTMVSFIIANPRTNAWSFTELESGCCGSGPFGALGCDETAPLCDNRDGHLFWDANHPTQAASAIAAQTLFAGNRTFVSPINVRELAQL
ncbi:GDSL esterase/lipase At1g29660-like [Oryza brachyantha]|uniref:GDSL esterase/lipase n=1 Tax=Oryza brachyantha TaxID=4533 RepID=J3LFP4_ORYBR|nr:GDSL esterase/lipase At1g29660-like [Oryza brachyantha]